MSETKACKSGKREEKLQKALGVVKNRPDNGRKRLPRRMCVIAQKDHVETLNLASSTASEEITIQVNAHKLGLLLTPI